MKQKVTLSKNPYEKANWFSRLTFCWLSPLLATGRKRMLTEEDLYELSKTETSNYLCDLVEQNWENELTKEKEQENYKASLWKAMLKGFKRPLIIYTSAQIFLEIIFSIQPLIVMWLVEYFERPEDIPVINAYIYAGALSLVSLLGCLYQYSFYMLTFIGFQMKAAMCALIYKKTLRISQKSLGKTTSGHIINLGSTDVLRFDDLPFGFAYLIVAPLQFIFVAIILWINVGWAMFGMMFLFLLMLLQGVNANLQMMLREKTAKLTDERIRIMREILIGMRIVKMYAWEKPFSKLIEKVRGKEMHTILKKSIIESIILTNHECTKPILTFLTFIIYVSIGGEISPSLVFLCISMYTLIQLTCAAFFPLAIGQIAQCHISIKRIEAFISLEDRQTIDEPPTKDDDDSKSSVHVSLSDVTADWSNELCEVNTLSDIDLQVEKGSLVALIGPVGAGKSSVLQCLLGELPVLKGDINVPSHLSYAAQLAWINAGTVRDNILLNEPYQEKWYNEVITACGLTKDIESFVNGDMTLIGERGITLSGGQKARVSLARAVYRRDTTDVFLLDDPLSAVDASVGKHLFDECICGLLKGKTRILVTHQLQFLEKADKIMVLKEGSVAGCGTFEELVKHGTDFATLLKRNEANDVEKVAPNMLLDDKNTIATQETHNIKYEDNYSTIIKSTRSLDAEEEKVVFSTDPLLQKTSEDEDLGQDEDREGGYIDSSVYVNYFRHGLNGLIFVVTVLAMTSNYVLMVLCDWWVAVWAENYINYKKNLNLTMISNTTDGNVTESMMTENVEEFDNWFYIRWYTIIVILTTVTMALRAIIHFYMCVRASIKLHNKMFTAIIRTGIRYFDANPTGRIYNRFSKDMGQIDEQLPQLLMEVIYLIGIAVSSMLVAAVVNYFVIIIIIPITIYFIWLRQYFMHTARDIKRLEGTTRSPVFSLLSATIEGLTTIRAFKLKTTFEQMFHEYQDVYGACYSLYLSTPAWTAVRYDFLASIFVMLSSFTTIALSTYLNINASQAGLLLIYSFGLMGLLQWTVRRSAMAENLMTSVERVLHYATLEPEEKLDESTPAPPSEWPQYGIISFMNASYAHYEGGPKVLNKLRFNIRAKEKVGIVGRTGAGKSSLISSLFRMNELSDGEIIVDGVTTNSLRLSDLRSSLSIIPQDPMLFTGTIRLNLDPFAIYSDEELWRALEQVQLKSIVQAMPEKLDAEMQEGGGNFSVGQRQLVCLARALLKKNKILVIDEATANVDLRTDMLIQQTIRENFSQCTVLTIAHRLNTIIDSDRVLVLDQGTVHEFDPPYLLLKKEEGMFHDMVKSTGDEEYAYLRQQAKKAYDVYMETQYEKRDG